MLIRYKRVKSDYKVFPKQFRLSISQNMQDKTEISLIFEQRFFMYLFFWGQDPF